MADDWNMPKGDLMKGKKGLVMGVANANSIAEEDTATNASASNHNQQQRQHNY